MSIDWTALSIADPKIVSWVHYEHEIGVASTPLLPAVPYVMWPTLDFKTASCQAADYFGSSS